MFCRESLTVNDLKVPDRTKRLDEVTAELKLLRGHRIRNGLCIGISQFPKQYGFISSLIDLIVELQICNEYAKKFVSEYGVGSTQQRQKRRSVTL